MFFTKKMIFHLNRLLRFPQVQRDLSMLVDKSDSYSKIEDLIKSLHIKKLQHIQLFDVFENIKLGEK